MSVPVAAAFFERDDSGVRLRGINDALDSLLSTTDLDSDGLAELVVQAQPLRPLSVSIGLTDDQRCAAVFADTREPKDVLESKRRLDAPFELLVNTLDEAVWILSNGRISYANSAALSLLRQTHEKLVTCPFIELVYVDDRQQISIWLDRVSQGHQLPPFECRICQPDGHTRLIELSGAVISALNEAVVACGRDITERKRSETNLLQADRLASLGMLAGGMAHSLNNPLTYVLLNLDHLIKTLPLMVGDKAQISDAIARLTEAREGAERMASTVKRMRNLARTEDSEIRAVNLGSVLESVVEIVGNEMHHRGKLNTQFASVPPVIANESRIEHVFLGLVLFAARMLPEDTARTNQVQLRLYADDQQHAVVDIICEGSHLDSAQLGSLFDPFAPSDEARTAGFGLSVCHSIVEQLGGQIRAESNPEAGIMLTVILPCAKLSYSTDPPLSSNQQSSSPPLEGGSARILVIDDDPGVGRALRLMLEDEHEVTSFTSPREALRKLLQDPGFDVIFCDLMMPELTGMDIYQVLRFNRPGYESRIVFMTGGVFTVSAKRFLTQVPNARVEKPFNLKALQRMVQRSTPKRSP